MYNDKEDSMKSLEQDFTDKLYAAYEANSKYAALENAISHNGLLASLEKRSAAVENTPVFSLDLTKDKVSDQKASGRCWMFAALNTFRHKMIAGFQLEDFELSQAHTFFWDKYEKSNWFLEQVIATADQELTSRKVKFLLDTPQQDGGQWDMVVSLFEKYGVVPKSVFPESISSSNSRELNQILNKLLRQDAQILRELVAEGANSAELQAKKEELLQEVFNFLAMNLGLPPRQFDFSYRDKDNHFHSESGLTPLTFYQKYVDLKLDDYVSIINAPTADKPYGRSYTVEMLGNVVGSKPVRYLNVEMDRLKELAITQMKAGETVWFGSDVGQSSNRKAGVMAEGMHDFTASMDIRLTQNKAGRLDYSESLMTHAMVLTGVDLDENGKAKKWKVENSWGEKVGNNGYFVASDAWMDEYTYQIVVRKEFLTAAELAAYEAEPLVLSPWDPMGALAKQSLMRE
ncbi:aminopeptidase C [Streptococcus sanguinis SK49]|uniref:Aminopeptidase n=2 Tax=Streptococcus sanguinis TaxID=1305 RepID=F3UVT9_STRSA|nr:aminopeptidase C [Streptococcus sanguinis SK49]